MGRKALTKERKSLSPKAKLWVKELFPKLQDKALDKLTLDEIVVLTGKSKSTIYTYFTTKEEIYGAAIEIVLNDLEGVIYQNLPEDITAEKLYQDMLLRICEGISGISVHFLDEIQSHFPRVWAIIDSFTSRMLETFRAVYQKGMHSGEFQPYEIDLLMAMDHYFITSVMTDLERFQDKQISLDQVVQQYLELRINGLKSR